MSLLEPLFILSLLSQWDDVIDEFLFDIRLTPTQVMKMESLQYVEPVKLPRSECLRKTVYMRPAADVYWRFLLT